MEIVHCDEEIMGHIPSILGLLEHIYGKDCTEIHLFAVVEDGKLGFLSQVENNCVFINYQGNYTLFTVDGDKLSTIYKPPYTINFDDGPFLVSDDKVEHMLDFMKRDYPDHEGYDGVISYKQYNIEKDIMCEINFQQMYREDSNGVARIYPYHTKVVDTLFIDEDFEKRGNGILKKGFLPKKSIYYGKISFNSEEVGYKLMAIADFGLAEFISRGPYELLREEKPIRYSRITRVKFNGEFGDDWPFSGQVTTDYIDELIKKYGFSKEIPPLLMNIHNKDDKTIEFFERLVAEMTRVKGIYYEDGNTDMCMILKLVPDEN